MIYTVTFNPSLDYYVKVNNMKAGLVNRTSGERLTIGGKGINVSIALNQLGDATVAMGFVAGFTGKAICAQVEQLGICYDFIEVEGQSRINVKVKSNNETDINGSGAKVTKADVDKLVKKLKGKLIVGDWLIISGSVPSSLNDMAYANFLKELDPPQGVNIVVDAVGNLLMNALQFKPFLIKPNIYELCDIFGISPNVDTKEIANCAMELQKMGARNVIVSMGSSGAVMITENQQAMYVRATRGELINSVGAGDCMVAGFVHEYIRTGNCFKSLNYATAAGSACAFTDSLPTKEQVEYVESLML
jgi:1-phosphofructokinase